MLRSIFFLGSAYINTHIRNSKSHVEHFDIDHSNDYGCPNHHWTVLLHPSLPSQLLGPPLEILRFTPEFIGNIRHMIQFFAAIQYFINVLFHYVLNFSQILLKFAAIFHVSLVTVFALLALDNGIVVDKLKGTRRLIYLRSPLDRKRQVSFTKFHHDMKSQRIKPDTPKQPQRRASKVKTYVCGVFPMQFLQNSICYIF
mgnify:CR=1 FL=1